MYVLGCPTTVFDEVDKRVGEEIECARGIRVFDDVTELVERGVPLEGLLLEKGDPVEIKEKYQ